MVLDTSLINTQHYKVRIKGKVDQSRERRNMMVCARGGNVKYTHENIDNIMLRGCMEMDMKIKWRKNVLTVLWVCSRVLFLGGSSGGSIGKVDGSKCESKCLFLYIYIYICVCVCVCVYIPLA